MPARNIKERVRKVITGSNKIKADLRFKIKNILINTAFNDDDKAPENYQHEIAVKKNEGFCLLQPLFTDVLPAQKACNRFFNDREI